MKRPSIRSMRLARERQERAEVALAAERFAERERLLSIMRAEPGYTARWHVAAEHAKNLKAR